MIYDYKKISPYELDMSPVCRAIGREWMLICAEWEGETNAMTASWGFLGELWGAPSAICFIRPQRFTYHLADRAEYYSLAFFGEERRRELAYFGSHSGRDGDKAAACGMSYRHIEINGTPVPFPDGAQVVLICRRVYTDDIHADHFNDPAVLEANYPERDLHRAFLGEIVTALERCGNK